MILIIGLGNPGKKYKNTRHNIGFQVIDEFARKNNFPEFRLSKKYNSLISEKENIVLVKPQTFMNNSGLAIKKIIQNSKYTGPKGDSPEGCIQNSIVVHDDIDLPLGKIRISKNRGSAGHKGVESIIKEIKTKDFTRIRIGIHPPQYRALVHGIEKYVLQKFDKEEEKIIKEIIKEAIKKLSQLFS